MDERRQFQVASNDGHLVRCLIGIIESFAIGSAEEEQTGARFLIIDSANVKRRVTRRVLGVHVGAVKEQILQMLHQSVATSLCVEA